MVFITANLTYIHLSLAHRVLLFPPVPNLFARSSKRKTVFYSDLPLSKRYRGKKPKHINSRSKFTVTVLWIISAPTCQFHHHRYSGKNNDDTVRWRLKILACYSMPYVTGSVDCRTGTEITLETTKPLGLLTGVKISSVITG